MKGKFLGLMLGVVLIGANLYAADGDLIVNGNLGVGTTTPTQKLDVAGYIKGQSGLCIGNDCRTAWPSGGGGLSGAGTVNYLPKWIGSSSLGNSSLIDSGNGITVGITSSQGITVNQATAGNQAWLLFSDGGTQKWQLGKQTDNNFFIYDSATGKNSFWAGGGNVGLAVNGGYVGVGTTSPSYQLQLTTDSAAKLSTNTWTIASDSRLKTNIQPYTKGLKEILQINPVTYQYNGKGGIGHYKVKKKDPQTGEEVETDVVDTALLSRTNVGVVAQDIQAVVPESVTSHKGKINNDDTVETDILDFNSHSLTFILINAVKELKAEIDALNQQIADLKMKAK